MQKNVFHIFPFCWGFFEPCGAACFSHSWCGWNQLGYCKYCLVLIWNSWLWFLQLFLFSPEKGVVKKGVQKQFYRKFVCLHAYLSYKNFGLCAYIIPFCMWASWVAWLWGYWQTAALFVLLGIFFLSKSIPECCQPSCPWQNLGNWFFRPPSALWIKMSMR